MTPLLVAFFVSGRSDKFLPLNKGKANLSLRGVRRPLLRDWTVSSNVLLLQHKQKKQRNCCLFLFLVGVTRFELATSWSRTMRATNCATPRNFIFYYLFLLLAYYNFPKKFLRQFFRGLFFLLLFIKHMLLYPFYSKKARLYTTFFVKNYSFLL